MIVYNDKKEFIGIEEKDLQQFGLNDFAELLHEVDDFADLFVKTPGHIHNFKHVHWIDFIASADSIDQNKVILKVKGKNYRANIELSNFYLVGNTQKNGYAVELKNVRSLTNEEVNSIKSDLENVSLKMPKERVTSPQVEKEIPQTPPKPEIKIQETPKPVVEEKEVSPSVVKEDKPIELNLDDVISTPVTAATIDKVIEEPIKKEVVEEPLNLVLDDEILPQSQQLQEEVGVVLDEDDPFKDYIYDPQVASEDLGLPTDLVEEFIQDFIAQAKEFKSELYEAFETGKVDVLRMQSHKLKGVAANLRIEDAYDALVTINTSDNMEEVKYSLDKFYNVILKKLAGEPIVLKTKQEHAQQKIETVDAKELDEPVLEIKQEEPVRAVEETIQIDEPMLEIKEDLPSLEIQQEEPKSSLVEEEKIELDFKDEQENFNDDILKLDELVKEEEASELPEIVLEDVAQTAEKKSLIIDKEKNASLMGIDGEIYAELLMDFKNDAREILETMQKNLQEGNQRDIQKLMIRFKGMSENMYINELVDLCEKFSHVTHEQKVGILQEITQKIDSIK